MPKAISTGMDVRLTWNIQVRFIRLLHFESLVKHLGHGDTWDDNCILEHVYFIGIALLLSLLQSFNEWNEIGQVVNPKPVHHCYATSLGEFSYKFIVLVAHNGWTTFKAGVKSFICYWSGELACHSRPTICMERQTFPLCTHLPCTNHCS